MFLIALSVNANQQYSLQNLAGVNDITEDKQGFIWLTGQHGLSRFDGYNLTHFANNSDKWPVPFIWSHDLEYVAENLLVSTENNRLWLVDPKTGKASKVNVKTEDDSIYNATYFNGQYYVYNMAPRHLYRYDPKTGITTLIKKNVYINEFIKADNELYFYNHLGIYSLKDDKISTIMSAKIFAAAAQEQSLVFSTEEKLYRYEDGSLTTTKQVNEVVIAMTFEKESKNIFTINTKNQIKKYDQAFKPLKHTYAVRNKVQTNKIFHDSSNTLWLINSRGIERLTESAISDFPRLYDTSINGIDIENFNDSVIIGSYGAGLDFLEEQRLVNLAKINQQFSDDGKIITDLLTINDHLFIATFDGLWQYNLKTNSLQKVPFDNNNKILLALTFRDNLLYVATDGNGFFIYDLNLKKIALNINEKFPLSSAEIIDILPLNNQSIWLATSKNLDIYDIKTKEIDSISLDGTSKVISLVLANNKIYVATKGDGIFVFSQNKELLSHFAVGNNFGHMRYINGEIWAPSNNGLFRISTDNNKMTLVPGTEKYSFTGEPIKHNNSIYVGHQMGVLEVPISPSKKYNPKVHISKTTISGQTTLLNKAIKEASSNDVITLDLASLDYRSGQEKQFKYQINKGIWNQLNGNQLTLTGLASGDYHIEIMATNSLGQWSTNKAYTEINVAYPWFWTPKIRVVYGVTILGIVCMALWLLYLRTKSISHIHHLLSSDIKNKGKVALNVTKNLSLAQELLGENNSQSNIEKTQQLLEQSIKELQNNLKAKEPDGLYGNSLLVALPYFSDYIHKKYHINISHKLDINEDNLSSELQADIYKIIYEAINAAILNGNGRNFNIVLQEFKDKIWITISDDANSFTQFKSKINFDMAMYYIRQIANKHNASINTYERHDDGSQLAISIPLMDIS